MGDVLVTKVSMADGRVRDMTVRIHGLPERTIDRDKAVAWMRDGHSLVPWKGGRRGSALQLVEVGDGPEWFIRTDNAAVAADDVPDPQSP